MGFREKQQCLHTEIRFMGRGNQYRWKDTKMKTQTLVGFGLCFWFGVRRLCNVILQEVAKQSSQPGPFDPQSSCCFQHMTWLHTNRCSTHIGYLIETFFAALSWWTSCLGVLSKMEHCPDCLPLLKHRHNQSPVDVMPLRLAIIVPFCRSFLLLTMFWFPCTLSLILFVGYTNERDYLVKLPLEEFT